MTVTPRAAGDAAGAGGEDTAAALRAIVGELSEQFYERADVSRMLVVAMLARQHSLVLGPPGTAKSELARELTGRITGARMWEILLSRFTSPTSMFGPIDVAALATRGEYTQLFSGRATTAHIAFVDEIFKCSAAALNAMLAYLNERLYHPEGGGDPIECPLISAVCASNELPDGEETGAIYDRLLVRLQVGYLADPSNFAALLRSGGDASAPAARTTVDLADLTAAVSGGVPRVAVPDSAVDAVCQLRSQLRRESIIASDRRWKASVRLLQASAWLDGRDTVAENDLQVLAHALWESPVHRAAVQREVLQLVNPHAREALDITDAIDELAAQLDSKAGQSEESLAAWATKEANSKLRKAGKQLAGLRQDSELAGRSTEAIDRAIARHAEVQTRVLVEALGISPSVASGASGS
ncbi:MAG: AAA family ATPase [Streptosporangiales bacterium]|nr:AAA family ATPase [Streptosporangiales bacterium]